MKLCKTINILACLLLCAIFFLANHAFGQTAKEAQRAEAQQTQRTIEERHKEELHKNLPIQLSGLEQGDNGFRENTPALIYSDRKTSIVDRDQLYKRKLAMYEKGNSFHAVLTEEGRVQTNVSAVESRVTSAGLFNQPYSTPSSGRGFWMVLAIPFTMGLIALVKCRRRRMLLSIEAENNRQRSMYGKAPLSGN